MRQAKGGGKDRARGEPASHDGAPPGVRPPPPKPERSEQPVAAAAPPDESSSSSRSSSSGSDSDPGQGPTPPVVAPDQDMSAWSRRQVRKTTAAKTRTKPPESAQGSEEEEPGEATSPDKGPKEEEGNSPPQDQAEAEPEPGPPAGTPDTVRRFDISCRDGPSRVTIRVGFDAEAPAQALLEACRARSRLNALSILREPDGLTLELSVPVNEQISGGVVRLVAEATADRATGSTSPRQGVEVSPAAAAAAAQAKPDLPGSSAGTTAANEQPSEVAGPSEAPPSEVAAKVEDEVPGRRKPLLSDDCCTCYACNISVPYKEMMGQHMMSEGHIHNVAVFYGLKPP